MPRAVILSVLSTLAAVQFAGIARAQDRYGPAPAADASQAAVAQAQAQAPTRPHFLSWPGKTATPARAPVAAAANGAPAYKTLSSYRAAPARPDGGWTPVRVPAPGRVQPSAIPSAPAPVLAGAPRPAPSQAASPPAAPTSIYAPAPPRQVAGSAAPRAPAATSGTEGEKVRFYSLHRQYGLQPDPTPIPPQFFSAASTDLADPPGPIPIQRLTSGSGSTATTRTIRGADGSDTTSTQQ